MRISTKSEAINGKNNDTLMTPLRTKELLDASSTPGDLIKVTTVDTPYHSARAGGKYRGSVTYTTPPGYTPIGVTPSYTTYGDVNFTLFNWYHRENRIYYEINVGYVDHGGDLIKSSFRVIFVKGTNI